VNVARSYVKNRYLEVVREVARRLGEVKRHETAADVLYQADQVEAAVDRLVIAHDIYECVHSTWINLPKGLNSIPVRLRVPVGIKRESARKGRNLLTESRKHTKLTSSRYVMGSCESHTFAFMVGDHSCCDASQSEKADVLAELGHTSAALDVLAQRGDWEKVWDTATKERVNAKTLAKYAGMRANQVLEEFSGE